MRLQLQANGARRGLSANSTQGSFTLTAGRKAVSWSGGQCTISDGTNTHSVILMDRFRGVTIGFGGVGSDNTTANYRVWLVRFGVARTASVPNPDLLAAVDALVSPYIVDTSTITLSTATGISGDGGVYLSSERIADTLTRTVGGIGTTIEATYSLGTSDVHSPADNTPARLVIPHLGGAHGFIIEFDMTGATSMNFDYDLTL